MSNLSQFFGASGGIKSIQTVDASQVLIGTVTRYYTWSGNTSINYIDITISPVDVNKTVLIYNVANGGKLIRTGPGFDISGWVPTVGHSATLLNSTTVRISGPSVLFTVSLSYDEQGRGAYASIQVVEFN